MRLLFLPPTWDQAELQERGEPWRCRPRSRHLPLTASSPPAPGPVELAGEGPRVRAGFSQDQHSAAAS